MPVNFANVKIRYLPELFEPRELGLLSMGLFVDDAPSSTPIDAACWGGSVLGACSVGIGVRPGDSITTNTARLYGYMVTRLVAT